MTEKIDKIRNNFTYHKPKDEQQIKYEILRESAFNIACQIEKYCPDSREKSLALTNLEQCIMWANASIARNE